MSKKTTTKEKYKLDIDSPEFTDIPKNIQEYQERLLNKGKPASASSVEAPKKDLPKVEYEKDAFGDLKIKRIHEKVIPHKLPLPQRESFSHGYIVGATGSGKSSALLFLVTKYVNLSGIIVCSLIEGLPIYDLIESHCLAKGLHYDFSSDIEDAYDKIALEIDRKPKGTHTLCIFDDIQTGKSMNSSSSSKENKYLLQLFSKIRNYGASVILITQSVISIPTAIRNNVNWCCYFKLKSKPAVDVVKRDVANMTGLDPEVLKEVFPLADTPHSYLLFTQDRIWSYIPPEKEGDQEIINPIDIDDLQAKGAVDKKYQKDKYTLSFPEVIKVLQDSPNMEIINFFRMYILILSKLRNVNGRMLIEQINDKYDLQLWTGKDF